MGILACGDFHAFGETCVAVMFDDHVGMGAVGCDDRQVERVEVPAGAMHFDEHRLVDLTVDGQYSSAFAGIPFDCGHTAFGLETMPVPVSPTVPSAYVTPSASGNRRSWKR